MSKARQNRAMGAIMGAFVGDAAEPARMSRAIANNTALTQSSETMLSMSVGYGCILSRLINLKITA